MKRLFILFALALSSLAAMAESYTVYYDNSSAHWGSVYVWAWGNSGNINGLSNFTDRPNMKWDSSLNLYYLSFELTSPTGLKFTNTSDSNGGDTGDLTFYENGVYNASGYTGKTVSEYGDVTAYGYTYTLYFDNSSANWTTPIYTWVWTGDSEVESDVTAWDYKPEMTYDSDLGLYYHTFTTSTDISSSANLKFCYSGNDTGTGDLTTFVDNGIYNASGYTGSTADNSGGNNSNGDSNSGETTTYEYTVKFDNTNVGWSNVYVWIYQGDTNVFSEWPGESMTYNEETGLYEITFTSTIELTDGTAGLDFSTTDANADPSQTDDLVFYNDKTYELALKTWTIYFDPTGVTINYTLCAYLWAGNVPYHEFPGSAMTYDSSTGYYVYQFTEWSTFADDGADVEFVDYQDDNNKAEYGQDESWALVDNGIYNASGYVSTYDGSGEGEGEGEGGTTTYEYTVKFDNTNVGWSNVYVWVYQDSSNVFTTWQGDETQMTYNEETGLYEITFTSTIELTDGTAGLDFSTTDANADPSQTDDLVFYNNKTYELTLKTWTIYFDPSGVTINYTLCAYLWAGNVPYHEFPGSAMTYDSSTGYYVYQFTEWSTFADDGADVEFVDYQDDYNKVEYGKDESWALVDNGIYNAYGYTGIYDNSDNSDNSGNSGDDNSGDDNSGNSGDDNSGNSGDDNSGEGEGEGDTTGLNAISSSAADGPIYNMQGIRVNDMSKKGIYIVGGRKVVVR